MKLRTCVAPNGNFVYGFHKPAYRVANLRENDYVTILGQKAGSHIKNTANFPAGDVEESQADIIFEIPNAFPFRGTTFLSKRYADRKAAAPQSIRLPERPAISFASYIRQWFPEEDPLDQELDTLFQRLPEPLCLALAVNSTDSEDLVRLAELSAAFTHDKKTGQPTGLVYETDQKGHSRPDIKHHDLFEAVANNRFLPDIYKNMMVLRPGAQGNSEIVGEWRDAKGHSHVFEYLRRNSYIPWGHYAANMAHDAVRYRIADLTWADFQGMRHLYYQRTYLRLAEQLDLAISSRRKQLAVPQLEDLRKKITAALSANDQQTSLPFTSTLWGWNFGFDFAPSKYRLHASHQQIHQQYALLPDSVAVNLADSQYRDGIAAYACGDLVRDFCNDYRQEYRANFFENYIQAIRNNQRMDNSDAPNRSLIIFEDPKVLLFVPKAQTSQWELQVMTVEPVGNILETDTPTRQAVDRAIYIAMNILENMGMRMVSGIEYSKRFNCPDSDQRLLYCFLPKTPQSPGAFSEAQLRWINNHYPEDFAAACRLQLPAALKRLEA